MAGVISPRSASSGASSPYDSPAYRIHKEFSFAKGNDCSMAIDSEAGFYRQMSPVRDRGAHHASGDSHGKVVTPISGQEGAELRRLPSRRTEMWSATQGLAGFFGGDVKSPMHKQHGGRLAGVGVPAIAILCIIQVVVVLSTAAIFSSNPQSLMRYFKGAIGEDLKFVEETPYRPPVCRYRRSYDVNRRRHRRSEQVASGNGTATPAKNGTDGKLPLLIFIVGIEGCGHHYIEQVLLNIKGVKMSLTEYEPDLHLTWEETQGETGMGLGGTMGENLCAKLPYSRLWSSYVREIAIRLGPLGDGIYVRSRDSFPMGRVRTPLARPDLLNIALMDGIIYDLKLLVLVRNVTGAFTSAYRRGYHDGDLGLMARIMEDEMLYIDTSLRTLPCGSYMVLNFDRLAHQPEMVAGEMADFLDLGVDKAEVLRAFDTATKSKPSHDTEPPTVGGDSIEDFFARRSMMWPMLHACTFSNLFFPLKESDWPIA